MRTQLVLRLKNKWHTSIDDFYEIESIVNAFKRQGGSVPRNLSNLREVPGLLLCERMERLLLNDLAWKGVRGKIVLRKKMKEFLNMCRIPKGQPS